MRFRYLLDPLFLGSVLLYVVNRCWLKTAVGGIWLTGYFNDLLLIPAALPPLLWLHRRVGLREHDQMPTVLEILAHLSVWAVVCEALGPKLFPRSVGDWSDVAAYTAGALAAIWWWHRSKWKMESVREL